jgi:TolB-like protein
MAEKKASSTLPLPDKPSIAVLPFQNMSGDAEQEYFADGISEEIITALSRFHWFFVIARNSSFSYKGTSPDVRDVARDLGVKYVLEGSVRKGGNRVRITAQLIDATTGNHIWAERYDRELDDIFAVQDEITEAITAAVAPSFAAAETRRAGAKAPENLDSWDLVMRGNWHLWRMNREDMAEARQLFEAAIKLDLDSYMAHGGLTMALQLPAGMGWVDDLQDSHDQGIHAAEQALALNDQNALAHVALAMVHHVSRDNHAAKISCRKALDLNPNLAFAEGLLGLTHAHLGDYEDANLHLDNVIRQSPRDPTLSWVGLARVIAAFIADLPEEYLAKAKELTDATPDLFAGWRHVAAAYVMQARLKEAKAAIVQVLRLNPDDSLEAVRRAIPISNPEVRERFLGYLAEAGLPD